MSSASLSANTTTDTLKNRNTKRSDLTDLTGASYGEVINATTTLVAAGSNVNGVIIRTANICCYGSGYGEVRVDSSVIMKGYHNSAPGADTIFAKDIFIPAGKALSAFTNSTTVMINISYEVL